MIKYFVLAYFTLSFSMIVTSWDYIVEQVSARLPKQKWPWVMLVFLLFMPLAALKCWLKKKD